MSQAAELFVRRAGIKALHVPYKGSAPALTDLMGGRVEMMCDVLGTSIELVRAGKLRALAVTTQQRSSQLPQVPTLAEARAANVNVDMWYGIFAPPGTPADFVARLNRELKDILALPDVRAAFETQGMDPASSTPDDFRRLVEQDANRWAQLIKAQNISAE